MSLTTMRYTRAVCFVFIYSLYNIESLQILKLRETEAGAPLQSDLVENVSIYTVRHEEAARDASVPASLSAAPGEARLKRQSVQYPPTGMMNNQATMQTKSLYMFGQVLKDLYAAARRQRFSLAGIRPAVRTIRGKVLDMFFPSDSAVTNLFKWKLTAEY